MVATTEQSAADTLIWKCYTAPWWRSEPGLWQQWRHDAKLPIFLDTQWLDLYVKHFDPASEIWVAYHAGEPVGAVPLERRHRYGVVVRTWLGAGVLCPDHLDLLSHPKWASVLCDSFLNNVLPRWPLSLVQLDGVRATSPLLVNTEPSTNRTRIALWKSQNWPCPFLTLAASDPEALLNKLSKKLRDELRYLHRRVARDAPSASLTPLSSETARHRALAQLAEWSREKYQNHSSWNDSRFVNFHLDYTTMRAVHGDETLYAFGATTTDPWALAYVLPDATSLRYYQPGIDRRWSRYSPGKLLIWALLMMSPKQKWETFDFLRGDEPYKFEWGPQSTTESACWLGSGPGAWLLRTIQNRQERLHERP